YDAVGDADRQADRGGDERDHQRDAAPVEDPGQEIAAIAVRAEQEASCRVGRHGDAVPVDLVEAVPGKQGTEQAGEGEEAEDDDTAHGGAIAEEAVARLAPEASAADRRGFAGWSRMRAHQILILGSRKA